MHRSLRLMVCTALAVSAVAFPALAHPAKVALTQIDGDTTGLWMAMEDALDDSKLELVPTRHVKHVAERLELDEDLGDRDVQRLAAELEVDALIQGVFEPHGRKLRFIIFANGKKGKPFIVPAGDAGTDGFRKRTHALMMARLAAALRADDPVKGGDTASEDRRAKKSKAAGKPGKPKDTDEPVADTSDSPKAKKAPQKTPQESDEPVADTSDSPKAKKAPQKTPTKSDDTVEIIDADDDATEVTKTQKQEASEPVAPPDDEGSKHDAHGPTAAATAPAPPDDPGEPPGADTPAPAAKQVAERDDEIAPGARARFEPSPPATHGANRAAVRVDLGASASMRDLRFQTTAFANAPKPYKNTPVPGARVEAELYPFALADPNHWLAGLGVAGDFDQTVALTVRAPAEMAVPLKITERHYSFGLRYRLAFGHTPTSPTLTIGAGYGTRTFAVDRTGLMTGSSLDLPDVDYTLFDPGLAFRLPIGERFALTLGGRALLVTSTGQIQRADQYGKAKVLGGAASAGLEVMFGSHVGFRVAAEATQLDFAFAGTGSLANNRDGNAATIDVRGAADRYLGGVATLAVLY